MARNAAIGYPVKFKDKKSIFDDSKIESHSAITPTYKIPNKEKLNKEEFLIYQTVFKRFVAVFCANECVVQKTEIKIMVGDYEEFNLKGMMILEPGWTKFEEPNSKDKILPNLNIGDKVNHIFKPKEKETTPPKHYTIETLNNYLKNPFKEDKKKLQEEQADNPDDVDDTEDYKAIFEGLELGTEATRTGIIDNAIKSNYISLKKDVYNILPNGEFLIESLERMKISMDKYKTSELGQALKKVYHDEIKVEDSVKLACDEINEVFDNNKDVPIYSSVIGKCPKCGNDFIMGKYGYQCKDYKECKFHIPYELCNRKIELDEVRKIIENKESDKIDNFISNKTDKIAIDKLIIIILVIPIIFKA